MIFLWLLSIILAIFSVVFYQRRQYHIAKPFLVISMVLMIITTIGLYWISTIPYP